MSLPSVLQRERTIPATGMTIFLVDGAGAVVSALLLAVLAWFESFFGMPRDVLYALIPVAALFALYSFSMYGFKPVRWGLFLRLIAVANLVYVGVTLGLVFAYFDRLTVWGIAYFLAEKLAVICLSVAELVAASRSRRYSE